MKKSENKSGKTVRISKIEANGASYMYSLIVKESDKVASYRLPLYSIKIEMSSADGGHTEAQTGEIFADIGKAVVFYERLIESLATPLNLPYILEDAIAL